MSRNSAQEYAEIELEIEREQCKDFLNGRVEKLTFSDGYIAKR